jgi:pyruvate/2-oxoglutarate dehydrogenase complex dihydrolipoamide dehydrogenase (E3) component
LLAHRLNLRLHKSSPEAKTTESAAVQEEEILKRYSTDYTLIPTTIFSPTEYSFIGLSEEEA